MRRIIIICCIIAGLVGCKAKPDLVVTTIDGFALGTTYHIVVLADSTVELQYEIDDMFDKVNRSMSIYSNNSLISRINRNDTDSLDRHITYCIENAFKISEESDGLYDITVKPLSEAWGFAQKEKTNNPNIDSLLQFVGYKKIKIENGRLVKENPNTQLDLNSIAKGYTVDLVAGIFDSMKIDNYLVEIGGEIVCKGHNPKGKPWSVGIDKPIDGNNIPGDNMQVAFEITNIGLATSGNYRRFYVTDSGKKVAHTINPKTGISQISNLLSATILAKNCTLADAYGTMMMAIGLEEAITILDNRTDIMGYLIYSDTEGNFKTYCSPELEKYIKK